MCGGMCGSGSSSKFLSKISCLWALCFLLFVLVFLFWTHKAGGGALLNEEYGVYIHISVNIHISIYIYAFEKYPVTKRNGSIKLDTCFFLISKSKF